MPLNTFIVELGKFVDMETLKKFAKCLGEKVLKQFYTHENPCQ